MVQAQRLADVITGRRTKEEFYNEFEGSYSQGFDPARDLLRVGVVNQTTMLATETQAIADYFRKTMIEKYGAATINLHFADTRDTLCYATNDNQQATYSLLQTNADLAVVVGGYNSSNTSHIANLCEQKYPTYFINSDKEIKSRTEIHHFNYSLKRHSTTTEFLPSKKLVKIILTSGASCPDTLVDKVMLRFLEFFEPTRRLEEVLAEIAAN